MSEPDYSGPHLQTNGPDTARSSLCRRQRCAEVSGLRRAQDRLRAESATLQENHVRTPIILFSFTKFSYHYRQIRSGGWG
jgi:hypothetical protein